MHELAHKAEASLTNQNLESGPFTSAKHSLSAQSARPAARTASGPSLQGILKVTGAVLAVAALGGLLAYLSGISLPGLTAAPREKTVPPPPPLNVELVPDRPHTLQVPEDVRTALGIRKGAEDRLAVAKAPTQTRPLVLSGSTALDPTRLARVRARFAPAAVVEIGQVQGFSTAAGRTEARELRPGDFVHKGDVLGVFYSVDVGSKKNDLIDALVQLKLDQDILDRSLKHMEALPEVAILNARRNVEADRNAVARALNTLKTWGIPEEDIQAVYDEAEKIGQRHCARDRSKDSVWPRVVLKAQEDGTIVERNVAVHETVVDNTVNLFQIAKVDRLVVVANAPEDELPTLLQLSDEYRRWTVRTVGAAGAITGAIDEIGYLIDVNQHSAVVKGHIDNPGGRLRAGQFVTATVNLPPPEGVVEIPTGAIVDDGRQCVVFVQPDPAKPQFTLRRVEVTHRFDQSVFVRTRLPKGTPELTPQEKEQGLLPREPLREGERVLTTGVLELKKELEDRESKADKVP
jgi:cobalt-zinc-cadmium efflux system membrane fusion protein